MIKIWLALFFALVATPAEAGPVAAAIGAVWSWAGGVLAAGGFGAFLLRTVASVALSALARALGPKAPAPPGIKTEATTSGGTSPQKFIVGLTATGGQLIAPPMSYTDPGHTANGNLVYAIALSVVPGCTLERVIVDDAWVERGGATSDGFGREVTGDNAGKLAIDYLDGHQTAPHAGLMARFAADPDRPWSDDMVGPGTCYAVTRFKYSREHFNGLPSVRFEVLGIPLYDPRADSTVGGSGPQRWTDPATWTQTGNLAVIIYNVMRGIDVGAGLRWGGSCEAEDLPPDNWFAAMNACDLPVDDGNGGTVPQYHGGIEIALDDEPAAVIEELLKAACAQMAEVGGIWKIRVGGPGLPVFFFTDGDVLVSEEQEFDPFPSLANTWNGISATYPDPESLWEPKEAPPRYNPEWEAEDGGRRLVADLTLAACPYPEQVQRLMAGYIADHRRFRQNRLALPPEAAVLEPLDSVGYTSARYGYTAKPFEITRQVDHLMTLNQALQIREHDAGDFDWSPSDLIPWSPSAPVTTPPAPQAVPGIAVAAAVVEDAAAAARRPAIDMTWNPAGAADAHGLMWQIRLAGAAGASLSGTHAEFTAGGLRLVEGILPATDYEVRARLIVDRAVEWTGWTPVTTPDVRLGFGDLEPDVETAIGDTLQAAVLTGLAREAAEAAEAGAVLARNMAAEAAEAALESEIAARSSEVGAAGSASAAAGSASLAESHADDADAAASAASAQRVLAETARGQAEGWATLAATSESNAAGSANAAATSAGVSATTLSETQRALASTTALVAGRASTAILPFGLTQLGTVEGYVPSAASNYATDSDGVHFRRGMTTAGAAVFLRAGVPSVDGKVYRITAKVKLSHANTVTLRAQWMFADGTLNTGGGYVPTPVAANTITTISMVIGRQSGGLVTTQAGSVAAWNDSAFLRFGIQTTDAVAGGICQVYEILIEDLTEADQAARQASAAAGSANASATSAALASTKATEAGTYSAEALDYRNTAARLMSGGVSKNPVFSIWPGTWPATVTVSPTGGSAAKVSSGVRYINAVDLDATDPANNGPILALNRTGHGLDCSLSPRGVMVRMEIEYISGDLANSGSILRSLWVDTTNRPVDRVLKDLITPTPGIVQTVEVYMERPAGAVPASAANFALQFYGHTNTWGGTRAPLKVRVHRFDFEEVLESSATSIYQRAVAELGGIQSAVIGLRAVAGSGGALLELVAASDPSGSSSLARISAANILLEGSVSVEYLTAGWLTVEGRLLASYLDVDSLLTIQEGAGLSYQKGSVADDATDGLYFGHDGGRFGFAASRTNSGKRQSIKLASSTGLELFNARHFVSDASPPTTVTRTTNLAKTALPANTKSVSVKLVGGGAGGYGIQAVTYPVQLTTNPGSPGSGTTVRLYDGATLKHTFTAGGGSGAGNQTGYPSSSGFPGGRGNGGTGGGYFNSTSGTTHHAPSGKPGALVVSDTIDVSGWADPQIEITLGGAGAGGTGAVSNGSAGIAGAAAYTYDTFVPVPADVVPLIPTATGTMSRTGSANVVWPDLGPGLWMVRIASSTLRIGTVTIAPGVSVEMNSDTSVTFFASQRPVSTSSPTVTGSITYNYVFYSMGGWG